MPSRRRSASNAALLLAITSFPSLSLASALPDLRTPQHVFSHSKPYAPSNASNFTPAKHGYRGWSSWSLQAYKGKVGSHDRPM